MRYLTFTNKGEIEVAGLRLLGASSKRGQKGQIGIFGEGNKYALAILKRNGITVRVYSGTREHVIGSKDTVLRGEVHRELTIDGEGIGATDGLGPKWMLWMALRELLCNAIDEGEHVVSVEELEPNDLKYLGTNTRTTIAVEYTPEVAAIWENQAQYFRLDPEEGTVVDGGRILPKVGSGINVYRSGILVYTDPATESLHDYEIQLRSDQISAERIASLSDVNYGIFKLMGMLSVSDKKLLLTDMKPFEAQVACEWWTPTASWVDALEDTVIATKQQLVTHKYGLAKLNKRVIVLPDAWVGSFRRLEKAQVVERVLTTSATSSKVKSPTKTSTVAKAINILNKYGFDIEPAAVLVAEGFDNRDEVDGTSKDGVIYVLESLNLARTVAVIVREKAKIVTKGDSDALAAKLTDSIEKIIAHRKA